MCVDKDPILLVNASLQGVISASRSTGDGPVSSKAVGAVCMPAEAVEGVDCVAKMAAVGEERLGAGVFRPYFGLPGDIAGGDGIHNRWSTSRAKSVCAKKAGPR